MNGLYAPHMEMGSTTSPSSDSLNGLKFGRKIYFGDVGFVVQAKSGGGSSLSDAAAAGPPPPKKGRSVVQGGKSPMCVVEGCKVDLSDAKTYYSRHKVCGVHSKSPKVIVAGLEQRFCQQCSRFHQLPEFDQGKRSCRRRLAGHNERRRKPSPGSLFSSCYGYPSSSIFATETNSRTGAFLMDFTTYPRHTGKDSWPTTRESETGMFLSHPWQTNSENSPPDLFLQGSVGGDLYPGPRIPSGECFTGVRRDSGCALSLLSSQPNGSRNRPPSSGVNSSLNDEGASVNYQTAPSCATFSHFSSDPWGSRVIEASNSSHEIGPDLGLSQIPESGNGQYSGEFEVGRQSGRKYLE